METSIQHLPLKSCCRELIVRWSWSVFLVASVNLSGASLATAGQDDEDCAESTVSFMPLRDFNRFLLPSGEGDGEGQFEAQIAGDVALWGQRDVANLACSNRTEWSWANQVYASVLVRLRMLYTEDSAPVRPPSFMPKLTFQWIGLGRSGRSMVVANLALGHHSNGQADCPLKPLEDGCPQPKPAAPKLDINVSTGSFSTHYGQAGFYYQWTNMNNRNLLLGGAIEYHLPGGRFGALSEALRARYGPTRANATVGGRLWRFSLRGSLQQILNNDIHNRTTNIVEVFYNVRRLPDALALYVRRFEGRDYYNINFEQTIRRIEFGLTFNWQAVGPPGGI